MDFKTTPKGLLNIEFRDRYGRLCSVQESSFQEENCIWLGVDQELEADQDGTQGNHMHLTQEMVRELLPVLMHFVRNGNLGTDNLEEQFQVGTWVLGIAEQNRGVEGRIIEVHVGKCVVVRELNTTTLHMTDWSHAFLFWEPCEAPAAARTRYEILISENDNV